MILQIKGRILWKPAHFFLLDDAFCVTPVLSNNFVCNSGTKGRYLWV